MTLMSFLLLLLIAAICGALGQAIAGYSRGGCLLSIAVGFVGALLGSWLAAQLALPAILVIDVGGQPFPVVWAVVGSAIFSLVLGVLSRR
jgi:uncharacterized membrane protein YeaQ/YmgE (transglycosylase-associated protein family)